MSLPELSLQIIYARLAWTLIAASMLLSVLPSLLPKLFPALAQRTKLIVAGTVALVMVLPGAASPAHWLTLVFQYPSGLLAGYSLVALCARWTAKPVDFLLHPAFALLLSLLGVVLYLDAFGVLALGLYYRGFDADAAAVLAIAAALAGVAAIWLRFGAGGAALLTAVLLFSLLRLPTGNLWDALLDPLLWAWALGSVVVAARRQYLRRKAGSVARPLDDLNAAPELLRPRAGGIE
ncbi:hypothetical protein GTP44_03435 [Duganella sp. FT50W]|uniref:Uncharacterized protein n=1 Tax=Duganella lactea TaxID=2692173 RepID=A0A6L8MGQ8_9BURK|nr:hypothetical protein [Duganella lactea]MYM35815.1 hypothetical protein [Duganella lactea]MYM81012.1 hypothetical protein [Duganella lactea]